MVDNKTDKQLVWESIKEIEKVTSDYDPTFAMLPETIWRNYPTEDRLRIRGILLTNGIVTVLKNQHWAFQLTASGMVLKEKDLNKNGSLKKKNPYKQFWIGVLATAIGAVLSTILSAGLEVWKSNSLQSNQSKTIVLPKIQVVHDTIRVTKP